MKKYIFALIILFIIGCNSASEPEYSEAFEKIQGKWVMNYRLVDYNKLIFSDTFFVTAGLEYCNFFNYLHTGSWDNNNFTGKYKWYDTINGDGFLSELELSLKNTSYITGKFVHYDIHLDLRAYEPYEFYCYRIK